jgi:hypothetical protein
VKLLNNDSFNIFHYNITKGASMYLMRFLLSTSLFFSTLSAAQTNSALQSVFMLLLDNSSSEPQNTSADILFLHHSTGGVIYGGGVESWIQNYNTTNDTNYTIEERNFPGSGYPWDNYPYDYWNIWVNHAGNIAYNNQPTLEMLTPDYDLIVWKHCYPVSDIDADTGSPSVSSSSKRLENYYLQYAALKTKMHAFPDTKFLVWTGAARTEASTTEARALRARTFFNWVKNSWDEPGDNIFIWDFHELETQGGLYLLNTNAASDSDSHPNSTFANIAAPLFSQRMIDVIQGRGDSGSLTGE